jgi:hypothetical protein
MSIRSDRHEAILSVLEQSSGFRFVTGSMKDGGPAVLLTRVGGEEIARMWPSIYNGSSTLYYTREFPPKKAPGRVKLTMGNFPLRAPILSVLAACVAVNLSEETVKRILTKKQLTPDGRVPHNAVRSLQKRFHSFLKEFSLIDKGPGGSTRAHHLAWKDIQFDLQGGCRLVKEAHDKIPSIVLEKEMSDLRGLFRSLKDKIRFDDVRQVWDEEVVRGIHEA